MVVVLISAEQEINIDVYSAEIANLTVSFLNGSLFILELLLIVLKTYQIPGPSVWGGGTDINGPTANRADFEVKGIVELVDGFKGPKS